MFSVFSRKRPSGFKVLKNDGYFGIMLINPQNSYNVGTVLRTAQNFGVDFVFIVGSEYKRQPGDVNHSETFIPFLRFETTREAIKAIPKKCKLITLEQTRRSVDLRDFSHPKRAIYVFGNEKYGVPQDIIKRSNEIIHIDTVGCLNLAVTSGIVMYDRQLRLSEVSYANNTGDT